MEGSETRLFSDAHMAPPSDILEGSLQPKDTETLYLDWQLYIRNSDELSAAELGIASAFILLSSSVTSIKDFFNSFIFSLSKRAISSANIVNGDPVGKIKSENLIPNGKCFVHLGLSFITLTSPSLFTDFITYQPSFKISFSFASSSSLISLASIFSFFN